MSFNRRRKGLARALTLQQVRAWVAVAGFKLVHTMEGDGYRHYLTHE